MKARCFEAIKIVHRYGHFDWLISGHQSVNSSREATSIMSGKYKRFTFVHPVGHGLEFDTKYHILHDFRTFTSSEEKTSYHYKSLHKPEPPDKF